MNAHTVCTLIDDNKTNITTGDSYLSDLYLLLVNSVKRTAFSKASYYLYYILKHAFQF